MTERSTAPIIRKARPGDQSYVASSWIHALRHAGYVGDPSDLVDRMLDRGDVRVVIAAKFDNDDKIMGWIAYTEIPSVQMLHFVYVRNQHRGEGVARALFEHAGFAAGKPLVYTMLGRQGKSLTGRYRDAIHLQIGEFLKPCATSPSQIESSSSHLKKIS